MRILHVLDISIPTLAGYTSRSRYIVRNQRALGIHPIVLTSERQAYDPSHPIEEYDHVRYYRTPPSPEGSLARRAQARPVARELVEINHLRRRIVEVADREEPDFIHGHSSILAGLPALFAARELGIPCVYEIRAFWEDAAVDMGRTRIGSPRYVATRGAETWLARQSDALIGICQGIKRELVSRGIADDDIHVIPNGVEVDRFVPTERDPAIVERFGFRGKTVVAYIGTFARFEGVPYLVRALVDLIQSGRDDIRGLIVGAGETYEDCRRIAADAGLSDKIVHPGKVPHDEVRGIYSVVDLLAYPRDRQRITELVTPLKPLEAMAMKKPVIGSDVGGLTELIQDGKTGLIHRAEDVADLADKIRILADDSALRARIGEEGRRYVEQTRPWRRIIEGHFDVYDRARANWNRRRLLYRGVAKVLEPIRSAGL